MKKIKVVKTVIREAYKDFKKRMEYKETAIPIGVVIVIIGILIGG